MSWFNSTFISTRWSRLLLRKLICCLQTGRIGTDSSIVFKWVWQTLLWYPQPMKQQERSTQITENTHVLLQSRENYLTVKHVKLLRDKRKIQRLYQLFKSIILDSDLINKLRNWVFPFWQSTLSKWRHQSQMYILSKMMTFFLSEQSLPACHNVTKSKMNLPLDFTSLGFPTSIQGIPAFPTKQASNLLSSPHIQSPSFITSKTSFLCPRSLPLSFFL